MATYCISDIHGCYNEFQKMLELINFQESDSLYILGDIVDRGPQVAEMLWYATEEAPQNVYFLLGNHEDMMLAAANNYVNRNSINIRMHDNWSYNQGLKTIDQISCFFKYYAGWEKKILDWVDSLPLYYDIIVNNTRFILIHAGLQSERCFPDDCCYEGKNFTLEIAGAPCPQESQALLWNRHSWIADKFDWPFHIVCGHTPISHIKVQSIQDIFKVDVVQNVDNGILHIGGRKHLIDCGCNRGDMLACLRLDDMQEFYVESEQKSTEVDIV